MCSSSLPHTFWTSYTLWHPTPPVSERIEGVSCAVGSPSVPGGPQPLGVGFTTIGRLRVLIGGDAKAYFVRKAYFCNRTEHLVIELDLVLDLTRGSKMIRCALCNRIRAWLTFVIGLDLGRTLDLKIAALKHSRVSSCKPTLAPP